jgi:hypothetical protein
LVHAGLHWFHSRSFLRAAVAGAGALAALLRVSGAGAYCPEVAKAPPPNYDPVAQGCFVNDPSSGRPLPTLFWKNPCVGYSIQRSASAQVSLVDATRVAAQAFSAWSSAACANGSPSITAVALSPVDCSDVPSQEHNNVIIFRDNGWPYADKANTLGYTTLTVNTCTGEIYGADIEINTSDYKISASGQAPDGGYDLATILTHEAGHFLGLAHSAESSAIMYAAYHPGAAALTLDDVGGICSIYPAEGTRMTSIGAVPATSVCDPSPRLGFLSVCGSRAGSTSGCGTAADAGDGGAAGDDGGSAVDGGNPCPSQSSCAVAPRGGSRGRALAALGLVALAALASRARRGVT